MTWRDRAACIGNPEPFWVDQGKSISKARQICAGCVVTVECLAYALTTRQAYGVWGGLAPHERR